MADAMRLFFLCLWLGSLGALAQSNFWYHYTQGNNSTTCPPPTPAETGTSGSCNSVAGSSEYDAIVCGSPGTFTLLRYASLNDCNNDNFFVYTQVATDTCYSFYTLTGVDYQLKVHCANEPDTINACIDYPCTAHAKCTDLPAPADNSVYGRTCTCNAGYAGDGNTNCSDINACISYPCAANAACTDLPAPAPNSTQGRTCSCNVGYAGNPNTACVACLGGFFALGGKTSCTACASGKYSNASASSTCSDCPSGTFSPQNSSFCAACGAGYFSAPQSKTCAACVAGTYSNVSGSSNCFACDSGTFSARNATACLVCTPGFYASAQATVCSACPVGTFNDVSGGSNCTTCSGGSFGTGVNATVCNECVAGTYSVPGSSGCTDCPGGTFSNSSRSSNCSICPGGTYSNESATTCEVCNAGFYSLEDSTTCTACARNTFSNTSQSSSCFDCGDGTYSLQGATTCLDINACIGFPCAEFATCTDLPAPAPNTTDGRTCQCNRGYIGNANITCTDICLDLHAYQSQTIYGVSGTSIIVHRSFVPIIQVLEHLTNETQIQIQVISSVRPDNGTSGTSNSRHKYGAAVDFRLFDPETNQTCYKTSCIQYCYNDPQSPNCISKKFANFTSTLKDYQRQGGYRYAPDWDAADSNLVDDGGILSIDRALTQQQINYLCTNQCPTLSESTFPQACSLYQDIQVQARAGAFLFESIPEQTQRVLTTIDPSLFRSFDAWMEALSSLLGVQDQIEFSDQSQYLHSNITNKSTPISATAEQISSINQTVPGLITIQITAPLGLANTLQDLAKHNAHTLGPLAIQSLTFYNSTMDDNGTIIDTTTIYGNSNLTTGPVLGLGSMLDPSHSQIIFTLICLWIIFVPV